MEQEIIVFDLEWNIGYQPFHFNYYGADQTLRGEIIEIGAVKIDWKGRVLDTFEAKLRPRIFRKLQAHIAKVTGLTQKDLDKGEPLARGLHRFMEWCGKDAIFLEWGADDVPVLKQNLYMLHMDETHPTKWYDLQKIFLSQHTREPGEGMTLESVVTRLGIEQDRAFHSAIADTLYTCEVCRFLDLEKGIAEYPSEEIQLEKSLCRGDGAYHDFAVFRGYVDREAHRNIPELRDAKCPVCGAILPHNEQWQKVGNNAYCSLCICPNCSGQAENPVKDGVFLRYKRMRYDGLHWTFARCTEIPNSAALETWYKKASQKETV